MIQITAYLRTKEDLDKWKSLKNKAEFLHEALQGSSMVEQPTVNRKGREPNAGSSPAPAATFIPKPPNPETGYPCCQKKTPCKHWHWDSDLTVWVNELTGKTKEG